ncbi:MAG: WG repeat-containing protein [Bacteroidaceae bacterium]|nr:WG repeat-containing protein [Bacteroidaceae bacterium]
MKKTILLSCLLGMVGASLSAQTLKIKVDEKGKAGYVNDAGTMIVACNYDAAYPFENGFGKVMKGEKFGLVDQSGNVVVPVKWDEINYDEVNHIYVVKTGKKYGLLGQQGQELLKAQYSYISPFNCYGKALLASGGKSTPDTNAKKNYLVGAKYGVLNADGSVAIPAKYKGLYEFTKEIATNTVGEGKWMDSRKYYLGDTLQTDCKYVGYDTKGWTFLNAGILDERGNILLKPGVVNYAFMPHGNMVRYYDYVKKSNNFNVGYVNLQTQKKTQMLTTASNGTTYQEATDFMDAIAAVAINGTWRFIDRQCSEVKGGYKKLAKGTASNIWRAHTAEGLCDFFDNEGNILFANEGYTDAFFPRSNKGTDTEYLAVKKGEKWGLIDKKNNVKLPFEYDKINDSRYGWVPVMKNGKWGLQSLDNEVVIPMEYQDVISPNSPNPSATYVKQADQLWHVYNIGLKSVVGKGYSNVGYFNDGLAWAHPDKMTVTDSYLNRALNGEKEVVNSNFAYVIDDKGQEIIATPMPIAHMSEIYQEIRKQGIHPLSPNEVKKLQLKISVRQRHYQMDRTIADTDWDY